MLCSRCHKNIAVVFLSKADGNQITNEGLCLSCAKELGIKPVEQMLSQMNIDDQQMESMMEEMNDILSEENISELASGGNPFEMFGQFLSRSPKDSPEESRSSENKNTKTQTSKKVLKKKRMLDTYGINLTKKAAEGAVDQVIKREEEIARVIRILNRRTKNNPVLLGDPGVGKSAIAEGLAVRIAEKKVPAMLLNFEVYLLDFTAIVAGTQFRGQFESRLKNIIEEAKSLGNIILVIDELHNIMGAGDAEGAMSAANILKPALARGEIRILGATTLDEYRKHIEKDSALERRFQPVIVNEPSQEDTIEILQGIKHYYEEFHRVVISDEVVREAVDMAARYLPERFFPDKAIDLIDEASSMVNLKNLALVELTKYKNELKKVSEEKESAVSADSIEDYQKAADLKIKECRLLSKIEELESKMENVYVTREDLACVIESRTGIPVQQLTQDQSEKLLHLEEALHRRVIGQNEAVNSVANAIRRHRAGLTRKKRPVSFIFVGPTGIGKTELVKALTEQLFDTEDALIRVDMSEYMEKHSVSKMIGSPPGYVGYDDAGQLTEKVRRRPYSVILLDEVEKAHADVHNILLQILDDGKITDSHGKTVDFRNTVIIMTSNAGSNESAGIYGFGTNPDGREEQRAEQGLKNIFRPEFLNRVDEIISFHSLTQHEIFEIASLQIRELVRQALASGITLDVSSEVASYVAEKGYSRTYGARPIRRVIQKQLEDPLAAMMIRGDAGKGDELTVFVEDQKLQITKKA
ncbi:MAG: ATP-dependent Clp protease ATP-binding subunit [Clostridia bacterium]|nr:ATP-dependent Clp protease ATP-binding subunit [Clostridia bacterium]